MGGPIITADDVVRGGACVNGVYDAIKRMRYRIAAAMPVSDVISRLPESEHFYVNRAADIDGCGGGDGHGYGNGAQYKAAKAPAWAQYEAAKDQAWAQYKAAKAQAWAEQWITQCATVK